MRLTVILLTALCVQVSAKTWSQQISFTGRNVSLQQVLKEVERQTGFFAIYDSSLIANSKDLNISAERMPLNDFMREILKGQNISFFIKQNTIVLEKGKKENFVELLVSLVPITGVVRSAEGQPISGVNVLVKGTKNGTTTNANGEFSLNAEIGSTLVISSIGYERQEIKVSGNMLTISLKQSVSVLDETVVIAYGQTSKRLNTGNVSSVKAEEIGRQPVNNPLLALQGRVPGLVIEQMSGISGANITVRVQGQNSIANGNNPFYVIDGIPYTSENLRNPNGALLSQVLNGGSPLALINPAIIESIEVLKDADATAIYGSRAANGAILITTKRGKAGATKVDLNLQKGWGKITRKLDLLNTQQYLEIRREAYKNDGLALPDASTQPDYSNYDLIVWDQNRYTDWQKELIGGTANYQDYQVNVSGGSVTTQFLFGANAHRETSVFPGNLSDRKSSVQFNINHQSANNKFRFLFSGNYLDDNNRLSSYDITGAAINLAPNAPALYLADGSLNWDTLPNGNATLDNPVRFSIRSYHVQATNLLANSNVGYQLLPGLELSSNFSYNKIQNEDVLLEPLAATNPDFRATTLRSTNNADKSITTWIVEPKLTYKKNIGKGVFDGLVGSTIQDTKGNLLDVKATGYVSDAQMNNIKTATAINISDAYQNEYRYNAVFGRLGYVYNQKYILNITGRRDGTSRFGTENRFHFFYSIAGAWIFSEEKLVKSTLPFLNFGKLRVSYGTTGSDQVGDYSYLDLFSTASNITRPYQGARELVPTRIVNPYLQWEQTNKLNVGLDAGFMDSRILLSANYYRNISGNQLVSSSLPIVAGFNSINQNLPASVLNSGLELTLATNILKTTRFQWKNTINLTVPKNKLLEFPGLSSNASYNYSLVIGEPLQIVKRFNYGGVNKENGTYQFISSTGAVVADPDFTTDPYAIINTMPQFYGGFENNVSYKNFQLDFLLQFTKQKALDYRDGNYAGSPNNQPTTVLDRWIDKDHTGSMQKVSTLYPLSSFYYSYSNEAYTDASFIRLKNISVSWSLPVVWSNRLKIQSARVIASGQNLLTITDYLGDPETKNVLALPSLKMFTIGLQASL